MRPEWKTPKAVLTERHVADPVDQQELDPPSMLATLQQIDDEKIPPEDDPAKPDLGQELPGVQLRTEAWSIVAAETNQEQVVFRRTLAERGLEISKIYRLVKVAEEDLANPDARAYHLDVELRIKNLDKKSAHRVAYRLDGPNGLPREGAWYAYKVSFNWGGGGLRDVLYRLAHGSVQQVNCATLADEGSHNVGDQSTPFQFLAVDAQYFSAALLPDPEVAATIDRALVLRIGNTDPQRKTITNTSFRLLTKPLAIEPGKELSHHYTLFAGPKQPALLADYGLGGIITFGWYPWVAEPMTKVLEFFYHYVVFNYGVAVILLTIMVRLVMFPLSRRQALNAQTMQKLQPEIKKLQERYKKDMEGRTKAQQELFRKHNYNPWAAAWCCSSSCRSSWGCTARSRWTWSCGTPPCSGHAIRWCSNLAGPTCSMTGAGSCLPWSATASASWAGTLLQSVALVDDRALHLAAEDVHAAARRRPGRRPAEGDELHDDLHGAPLLQGGGRAVHLLHRLEPLGIGRAEVSAQGGRGGGGRRRGPGPQCAIAGPRGQRERRPQEETRPQVGDRLPSPLAGEGSGVRGRLEVVHPPALPPHPGPLPQGERGPVCNQARFPPQNHAKSFGKPCIRPTTPSSPSPRRPAGRRGGSCA